MLPSFKEKKDVDIMVDIETNGTERDSVILSIGAVAFHKTSYGKTCGSFNVNVTKASCEYRGLTSYLDTVEWWKGSDKKAAFDFISKNAYDVRDVLRNFFEFIKGQDFDSIWAKSPSFDLEIIKNAAEACNMKVPWKFWQERDVRTLNSLRKHIPEENYVKEVCLKMCPCTEKHTPIYDCVEQLLSVQDCLSRLQTHDEPNTKEEMRNVEIKAKSLNPQIISLAEEISKKYGNSGAMTEIIQDDYFFKSSTGRLKMRVINKKRGELIFYKRPDQEGPKLSSFRIERFEDPDRMISILTETNGLIRVVKKMRALFIAGQTRIHIDSVNKLGCFLELEVVLTPEQSVSDGEKIARGLMEELGVKEEDLVAKSYFDLLSELE